MAIALDATAVSTDQTASPLTWNHTCTGGNLLLLVGITTSAQSGLNTCTAVTYNGVSMTKARADSITSDISSEVESSVWLLFNPATGSNQVSATITGSGTSPHYVGGSASYTGAQQSSTADASNGTTGTTTGDKTFSVTTVADNCWIFAIGINTAAVSTTMTADQTSRGTVTTGFAFPGVMRIADTNAALTPAGAQTVGMTTGGTSEQSYAITAASFGPVAGTVHSSFPINHLRPAIFKPGLAR